MNQNNYEEDKELIKKIKSNDTYIIDEGYEGIYNKYAKLAFTCIYNIVKNYNDAEDLTSDTFLSIFKNREKLIEEKNFKYYIVTTAKNFAINFINKNKVEIIEDDNILYEDLEDNNSNISEIIKTLKDYLNEEEIKIVLNHLIYASTFEEIAKMLKTSPNTVKTKYYRAIKKVRM